MKKYLLSLAVLMMGTALFTACGDDDDDSAPQRKAVDVSEGLFIVGSGNTRSNIDGNLTYINYANGTSTLNAFQKANGISLGKTANFALIYGEKLYIAVDGENTIWVCNKKTLVQERRINTMEVIGETAGVSPRSIAPYDGKIYVSCYGAGNTSTVAAIDTVDYKLQATYTTGSHSDGVAVVGDKLFVADSDYGNGSASVTVIDLKAGSVQTIKHADITNPMQVAAVGNYAYVLDYGTYTSDWSQQLGAGVRRVAADGTVTRLVDGTAMAVDNNRIYTVYAPFGGDGTHYYIYDINSGQKTEWEPEGIFSPAAIAVDPITGDIFIVSYNENPDTGYPAYNLPTYVNQYSKDLTFKQRFDCGVGPISLVFNTCVKYE